MPPKAAKPTTAAASDVFVIIDEAGNVHSVHATQDSAKENAPEDGSIIKQTLIGGTVTVVAAPKKAAAKPKAAPKPKPKAKAESEEEEEEDDDDEGDEEPAPAKAAPKTKPVAEQRAANAAKAKPAKDDANLTDAMKLLLGGSGTQLEGLTIVVTGVPPKLTRKNAEKLVQLYGAKLGKSLSKKTDYVVVGNDAGPKKLDQIAEWDLKTLDEDALVAMLEKGGSVNGTKRAGDEDEAPKAKKAKK